VYFLSRSEIKEIFAPGHSFNIWRSLLSTTWVECW